MYSVCNFEPFRMFSVLFLIETEEGKSVLPDIIILFLLWSFYEAFLYSSPIFHTHSDFIHSPLGNTITYTPVHYKNPDL